MLIVCVVDEDTTFDELAMTDELDMSTSVNDELECVAEDDAIVLDVAVLDELSVVGLADLSLQFKSSRAVMAIWANAYFCDVTNIS